MISSLSRPLPKLIALVALQFLILGSIIGFKQYTVWTGETVLLRTQPVDPHDLVRGDHATVSYEISRLDSRDLAGDEYPSDDVYVELREASDGYWDAVAIHDDRKRSFDGTVLIKGTLKYAGYFPGAAVRDYSIYEVEYGIEQVFIPEGSASQIPDTTDDTVVAVEVKVDRFGNAVPRRFIVDGEPLDLERR
jgi:uncharacterized membrane-anchored protein